MSLNTGLKCWGGGGDWAELTTRWPLRENGNKRGRLLDKERKEQDRTSPLYSPFIRRHALPFLLLFFLYIIFFLFFQALIWLESHDIEILHFQHLVIVCIVIGLQSMIPTIEGVWLPPHVPANVGIGFWHVVLSCVCWDVSLWTKV